MTVAAPSLPGPVIGLRIARLRARKGWSMRQLAERAELSHGIVQLLESGHVARPRKPTLLALAQALGWPDIPTMLGSDAPEPPPAPPAAVLPRPPERAIRPRDPLRTASLSAVLRCLVCAARDGADVMLAASFSIDQRAGRLEVRCGRCGTWWSVDRKSVV